MTTPLRSRRAGAFVSVLTGAAVLVGCSQPVTARLQMTHAAPEVPSLSPTIVNAAIATRIDALRRCEAQFPEQVARVSTVRWTILPSGEIADVTPAPEDAAFPAVACFADVIRGIRFPASRSAVQIAFPLTWGGAAPGDDEARGPQTEAVTIGDESPARSPAPGPRASAAATPPPRAARPAPAPAPPPRAVPAPPPATGSPAPARVAGEAATVDRFPTIELPSEVDRGDTFDVAVSLTEEKVVSEVELKAGSVTARGQLRFALPAPADPAERAWPIAVQVSAPAFEVVGGYSARITLPEHGDSDVAVFRLRARSEGSAPVYATFWHEHRFVGRAVRTVTVTGGQGGAEVAATAAAAPERAAPASPQAKSVPAPRPYASTAAVRAPSRAGASAVPGRAEPSPSPFAGPAAEHLRGPGLSVGGSARAADLTIWLVTGADPARPEVAEVSVHSPHLRPSEPVRILVPRDLGARLRAQYERFMVAGRGFEDVAPAIARSPERSRAVAELVSGFGIQLWSELAPDVVRDAIDTLEGSAGPAFQTIEIHTNDPTIPWELMRPPGRDFLGVRYRIGRWHVSESRRQRLRPPQRLDVARVLALAPEYGGVAALPAQAQELERIATAVGDRFERVTPTRAAMRETLGRAGAAVIHFAGHGDVIEGAVPDYALRLADGALTPAEWRGMSDASRAAERVVFLNACDLGRADRSAGLMEGWAPAVVETGAAAFIGGLWPLGDSGAADFARRFYDQIANGRTVGQALRTARAAFHESGDPTYLAYVLYGDPELVLGGLDP